MAAEILGVKLNKAEIEQSQVSLAPQQTHTRAHTHARTRTRMHPHTHAHAHAYASSLPQHALHNLSIHVMSKEEGTVHLTCHCHLLHYVSTRIRSLLPVWSEWRTLRAVPSDPLSHSNNCRPI